MQGPETPVPFLNLEYFFRLIYESRLAVTGEGTDVSFWDAFSAWFMYAWGVLGVVSFIFVIAAFLILIYATIRVRQIKHDEEHEKYSTLKPEVAEKAKDHSRWSHIEALAESAQENDWRQAIIEADIMLEEVLNQAGYAGASVGDKLKGARFKSIDDAWEAHKVRNDIAHRGSTFRLDDRTAYRTVKRYETVFREFGEI